uniref:Uncharacterized protein n=1 Tax=Glossina austeni TaxID=7395 RepID=A0A1A9UN07_GLOAU
MTHHPGECPITLTSLIEVISIFNKRVQLEIGVQVATLPLPGSQWYISDSSSLHEALEDRNPIFRWSKFILHLNWKALCINSSRHNVETCEAMPVRVNMDWDDIMPQVSSWLSFAWYKIVPLNVTTIGVGQGMSRRLMRSYIDSKPMSRSEF